MPNFINYDSHGIGLDIRKLEQWALEREQHDENYDDFVRKLSDRIITIENKLDNGCGAKNNGWNHAAVISPTKDGYYLSYLDDNFTCLEFYSDHWYILGCSGAIENISNLWWMELPKPPEK